MILSDLTIESQVVDKSIIIEPFNREQLNPNSYDIRIGNTIKYYKIGAYKQPIFLDPKAENQTFETTIPEDGYILAPNRLYLANTLEHLTITHHSNVCATIMGKSSLGRLGLDIHICAGFVDNGFSGSIVLELRAVEPIKIYPGMLIAQIKFEKADRCRVPYGDKKKSKYQHQEGVQSSLMYKNFE